MLNTFYKTNMNTAKWTVLWHYSNPWITQTYSYLMNNIISNPSTKKEDSFRSKAQEQPPPVPNGHKPPTPAFHMSRSVVLQTAHRYHTTIATLPQNTNTHRTRYVEVKIQYSGHIITTRYTKHSITIRHHGSQYLWNTLSNTATRINANNALINSALTQSFYTSYRYNPWSNSTN